MGDSPLISDPLEALEAARLAFEGADDLTMAVEEEFAILDPATLELTSGYDRLAAAAADVPGLMGMTAGELIRSEIEIKTGRCETFAGGGRRDGPAAASTLVDVAAAQGFRLCAAGTHPWSKLAGPGGDRHPALPHRRVDAPLRGRRNNTFGLHVHVGIHGADRAIAVHRALRTVLPEPLALSSTSPWLEGRYTYLHSTRTEIFTKFFPRCGIPDGFADWNEYAEFVRFLVHTRSIREHTEIWWSVRPHQAYPTVETRICDGQPDFARSVALAGLQVALTADFARRYDAGEALTDHPARDLEENFWRAIRWGMSGELIDLELRCSMPAAERIERLLDLHFQGRRTTWGSHRIWRRCGGRRWCRS